MDQSVWQRKVSAQDPAFFKNADGILELHACTLMAGAAASTLRCSVAGATPFALGHLTDSLPSCSLRLRLKDSAVLTCEGEALVTGVLHATTVRRRRQRQEDCAVTPPAAKVAKTSNNHSSLAPTTSTTAAPATASLPASSSANASITSANVGQTPVVATTATEADTASLAARKKRADKPLVPLSHRVLKSGLEYDVLKPGRGSMAHRAKQVHLRYEGRIASTGYRFDAGIIQFRLGLGEVIRGWDEGIQGMLVGECRRLFVPARLGYGPAGAPPEIPQNAALIFEVELISC